MAKATKEANRRAVVEQLRREQQRKERRQGLLVLGIALVLGIGIVAFASIKLVQANQLANRDLSAIGQSSDAAACQPPITHKPQGTERSGVNGNHVTIGQPIHYRYAPPAFGQHWPNYLTGTELRSFYSTADAPPLERLVHSLEHGYTILWYDDTIAKDSKALADVRAIAAKFDNPVSLSQHFIAAPWTTTDGPAMPGGAHVALTHWSRGGTHGNPSGQIGVWQYCSGVSGSAVSQFRKDYPPPDAPESGAS